MGRHQTREGCGERLYGGEGRRARGEKERKQGMERARLTSVDKYYKEQYVASGLAGGGMCEDLNVQRQGNQVEWLAKGNTI
jgi:hypothetical protein